MNKSVMIVIIIGITLFSCRTNNEFPVELGNGYKMSYDDNGYVAIVDTNNTVMVERDIQMYNVDSFFIIICQKPVDEIAEYIDRGHHMKYNEREKQVKKNVLQYYWIINKKQENKYAGYSSNGNFLHAIYSNVYGPYDKEQYLQKRKELGVSRELKLKSK